MKAIRQQPLPTNPNDLLDSAQIAQWFGQRGQVISEPAVRASMRRGELKGRKCGGKWLISLGDLLEMFPVRADVERVELPAQEGQPTPFALWTRRSA